MTAAFRLAVASVVCFGLSGVAGAAAPALPSAPVPYAQLQDIDAQLNGPAKVRAKGQKGRHKAPAAKRPVKVSKRGMDVPDCPGDPLCPHL